MRQWLRKCRLVFTGSAGTLTIEDLKIGFQIQKSITSSPNTGTITVTNMNRTHRGMIGEEYDRVRLEAGYQGTAGAEGNVGTLFDGFIRDVTHQRDNTDIATTIEAGDGDKARRQTRVAKTYPAGTTPKAIVEDLQGQMDDVDLGVIDGFDDAPAFARPYVAWGPVSAVLDDLGRAFGVFWSVQDGALETIPDAGAIEDVVVLTPETGLVATPSVTDDGLEITALLNPQIRVHRVVDVRSPLLDESGDSGRYRVESVSFNGDNFDGEFVAVIQGKRL